MATLQADTLQLLLNRLGMEDSGNSFPPADVLTRPLDIYRAHLADILVQLTDCEPQVAYDSIQEPNDYGDLEVVIPRLRLKGSDPKELAFDLAQKFPETPLFDQPFEDGIHLRLYASPQNLARILLPYILDRGKSYGSSPIPDSTGPDIHDGAGRRVIVDFSSPNLGREFDGAHLRSTIIGSSIASLYEGMGWDVRRLNFLGDWGKHIGLLAVGWHRFGSDELLKDEPLRHLLDVYTKIDELSKAETLAAKETNTEAENEGEALLNGSVPISAQQDDFNQKMEEGDADAVALWKRLREACVTQYADLYAKLHISFDDYSGESEIGKATIAEIEAILTEKGVYEESNGAWIIDFKKHGMKGLGTVTARHPNGTTSYLLRDVGAVLERRKKYDFDKMVYVVSAKQDIHFQQLFRTLELMGDEYHGLAQSLQHVNFGPVRGLTPQSGSSGLLLGDILEQSQEVMQESLKTDGNDNFFQSYRANADGNLNGASEFARLALMSQELSTKRSATLNFTLGTDEKIGALADSYPGLRVQRWLDNLRSKVWGDGVQQDLEHEDLDYALFEQEEAYADMLKLLARFPVSVKHAFEKLEPPTIVSYLLQVIDMLPSVWDDDDDNTRSTETGLEHDDAGEGSSSGVRPSRSRNVLRSVFYQCVRTVLENGMNLIGIVPIQTRGQEPADVPAATALPNEASEEPTPTVVPPQDCPEEGPTVIPQDIEGDLAMPGEANEGPTPTASLQNDDEATDVSEPQEVIEGVTLPTPPPEVNDEVAEEEAGVPAAGDTSLPEEVSEVVDPTVMLQEVNGETIPPAAVQSNDEPADVSQPQEGNEETPLSATSPEDHDEAMKAAQPLDVNEETTHPAMPEVNEETSVQSIPPEDNGEAAGATQPEEIHEVADLTGTPQGSKEDDGPIPVSQKINEDAAPTAISQEDQVVPTSTIVEHEVDEAPPVPEPQNANGDAEALSVPGEVDVEAAISEEMNEASIDAPHSAHDDEAVTTTPKEAGVEEASVIPPEEVDETASNAVSREINEESVPEENGTASIDTPHGHNEENPTAVPEEVDMETAGTPNSQNDANALPREVSEE
ncbi:arginine-tRNA ligase [Phialophora macrospora]|uniref:arginine--tRNA ligase n=1 Tax=Phialophora macrospora TaxID=1851006 RepID=A0A0D2CW31_9EURO|nr:arginine-tRNA ligase [Phialophora macrospora]